MEHYGDVFQALLGQLSRRKLAYVHAGIFDGNQTFDTLGGTVTNFLRDHYSGALIGSGGYTPETAAAAVANRCFDLAAIGRLFIANPDLITKIRPGAELDPYDDAMLKSLK